MEDQSSVGDDCLGSEPNEVVMEVRDWSELTSDCLTNIFHKLSLEDRWRGAMLACRSWLEAAKDPTLFSSFDLEPAFKAARAGRYDSPFWWTPAFQRRVDAMLRLVSEFGAGRVRKIRVRHCSDVSLAYAAERSPNLEILSVKNSQSITDASISIVASRCPLLRKLDISNCYKISYKSLEMIGKNCPNLTVLKRNLLNCLDPSKHTGIVPEEYLRACPQDGDREAASIAQFMPRLKHLELHFSKLTIAGLISITEGCQDLEIVNVFGSANLTIRALEQACANPKIRKSLIMPNVYIHLSW